MPSLSLTRVSFMFLRIGNLTFGGGDPTMIALRSELVATHRLLAPEKYGLIFALARITPGTNLLAFCAGAGWEMFRWPGAILAVVAVTVPSAGVVLLLSKGYQIWKSNPFAMAAIAGTLAAAVGMMATGVWQMVRPHLRSGSWLRTVVVVSTSATLSLWLSMSPIQVLALAAVAGLIWRVPAK